MTTFQKLVEEEVNRAHERGHICKSWHEAAGLIKEEYDEFWDEVKKKATKRDRANMLKELVQIASLCERVATELSLIKDHEHREEFFKQSVMQQVG